MAFSTGIGEHSGLTSPPEEILFVSETSPLQHVERQMRSSSGGDRLHQAIAVNNVSAPMSSYPIRPPHRPAAEPTEFTIEVSSDGFHRKVRRMATALSDILASLKSCFACVLSSV